MERKNRIANVGMAAVIIIIGLVLVFSPESAAGLVCTLFGIVMLVWGIGKIISFVLGKGVIAFSFDLILGIIMTLVGGVSLFHPAGFIRIIFGAAGISILLDGIGKIRRALDRKNLGAPWKLSMTSAIITTIAGVILTFNPFGTVTLVIRISGIAVLVAGVSNLVSAVHALNTVPNEISVDGTSRDDFSGFIK